MKAKVTGLDFASKNGELQKFIGIFVRSRRPLRKGDIICSPETAALIVKALKASRKFRKENP